MAMSHLYLAHHGIKGMKWGVRRFRNKDGSLTEAGKKRYAEFDRKKSDIESYANTMSSYAKSLAYEAKRLNSAFYDDDDDDTVVDSLRNLYGDSSGVDKAYINASASGKAAIVSDAYTRAWNDAVRARGAELGYRAMKKAMDSASSEDVFKRKKEYWEKIGSEELRKQMPVLRHMTATELMISMNMSNKYTTRYKELFGDKESNRARGSSHIIYDANGKILAVSPELEKALGVPISEVDDPELIELVAQELDAS